MRPACSAPAPAIALSAGECAKLSIRITGRDAARAECEIIDLRGDGDHYAAYFEAAVAALEPEELANIPGVPGTLEQALDALEADHEFLLKGDVFTPDVIDTWIAYKRENEVAVVRQRPHPVEYHLYYDV